MVNISKMSDEEIIETLLEAYEDDGRLNMDYIEFEVVNSDISIKGRVTSEEELQMIEEIMKDLKIADYTNTLWVDDTLAFGDKGDEDSGFGGSGLPISDGDELEEDYSNDDEEDYSI